MAPILASEFPGLRYSAALLGHGSDVLGFDSERSTDHEWGPPVVIFLAENDREVLGGSIDEVLSTRLPGEFRGYPTNFAEPDEDRVRIMTPADTGRVHHHVYLHSLREFVGSYLGVAPDAAFSNIDWRLMNRNALLELTGGAIYYDGLEELVPLGEQFKWYPHEVWLYMLANGTCVLPTRRSHACTTRCVPFHNWCYSNLILLNDRRWLKGWSRLPSLR